MAGEKKGKRAQLDGKRKERIRPLPIYVQCSGRICGFVVLAKRGNYLEDSGGYCEDNSIKG